jgi:hypothetical protein
MHYTTIDPQKVKDSNPRPCTTPPLTPKMLKIRTMIAQVMDVCFTPGNRASGISPTNTEIYHLLFQKIRVRSSCSKCGGYRYVPCGVCHGSKKSLHRNYRLQEFRALRCINCTENGLIRCDACLDQNEL